ncbi:MAG TPA: N-acetyltransferase [Methanospirillum sp.]|uniref:GNAT family N-acetyltransferase n=1 Tax=Methanospirillum sp. TaxID=45200 RepID=UPI002B7279AA|nr:N-acetyltransferase [Methanospirillum sp.]HWQ63332.1 N-acetyltransferase [Methanospirillum sp.]
MKQIKVREITEADYSYVCLLEQGLSGAQYQAAVFVRQAITLWSRLFLVGEVDDQIAGYLVGSIPCDDPSSGWILRVRVDAAFQRMGVASMLMCKIEDSMKDHRINQILLSCSPENHGALTLYHRQGYTVISRETAYFGPGEDRLILGKTV